jgi:hypothetical protein
MTDTIIADDVTETYDEHRIRQSQQDMTTLMLRVEHDWHLLVPVLGIPPEGRCDITLTTDENGVPSLHTGNEWTGLVLRHIVDGIFQPRQECQHCHATPCVINVDQMYDNLMEVGHDMEATGYSNHEIRYRLYRDASTILFGRQGAGVRKKLPLCVEGDIRDAYPNPPNVQYVGFQEAA